MTDYVRRWWDRKSKFDKDTIRVAVSVTVVVMVVVAVMWWGFTTDYNNKVEACEEIGLAYDDASGLCVDWGVRP